MVEQKRIKARTAPQKRNEYLDAVTHFAVADASGPIRIWTKHSKEPLVLHRSVSSVRCYLSDIWYSTGNMLGGGETVDPYDPPAFKGTLRFPRVIEIYGSGSGGVGMFVRDLIISPAEASWYILPETARPQSFGTSDEMRARCAELRASEVTDAASSSRWLFAGAEEMGTELKLGLEQTAFDKMEAAFLAIGLNAEIRLDVEFECFTDGNETAILSPLIGLMRVSRIEVNTLHHASSFQSRVSDEHMITW